MKIKTTQFWGLVLSEVFNLRNIVIWLVLLFLFFFATTIPVAIFGDFDTNQEIYSRSLLIASILSLIILTFYVLLKCYEEWLYVKNSFIDLTQGSLNLALGGFHRASMSIPIFQLNDIRVEQSLKLRLFRTSNIWISAEKNDLVMTGFNYQEAEKFVTKVTEKHKLVVEHSN